MTQVGPTGSEAKPLRVLLFSPVSGRDLDSGDTSYTDSLVSEPPPGVAYTTYDEAFAQGTLVDRGRKPRHGHTSATDLGLLAYRGVERLVRKRALFQEPTWFVTVDPSAFDLVHLHIFAMRQVAGHVPVVSSAGYPLSLLYREWRGWSQRHVDVALAVEDRLARINGAHVPWLRPSGSDVMTVYTEHFAGWLEDRGVPEGQLRVISTGLPALALPGNESDGRTLAVVARDYWRKGGDIAVAALDRLRVDDPSLHMIVATSSRDAFALLQGHPGVDVRLDQTRTQVLEEILPRTDVLLAPTRLDCGAPYGILEALQSGCGVVTSTRPWLDDRLVPPAVRRVAPEPGAVAAAVIDLLGGDRSELRQAANELWASQFSMDHLHGQLLGAYRRAVAVEHDQ